MFELSVNKWSWIFPCFAYKRLLSLLWLFLSLSCFHLTTASVNAQIYISLSLSSHVWVFLFFCPHMSGTLRLRVPARWGSGAASPAGPVFSCIPLESTCLLGHAQVEDITDRFLFFWLQVQERGVSVSVHRTGSQNCLEEINENLKHSCLAVFRLFIN